MVGRDDHVVPVSRAKDVVVFCAGRVFDAGGRCVLCLNVCSVRPWLCVPFAKKYCLIARLVRLCSTRLRLLRWERAVTNQFWLVYYEGSGFPINNVCRANSHCRRFLWRSQFQECRSGTWVLEGDWVVR